MRRGALRGRSRHQGCDRLQLLALRQAWVAARLRSGTKLQASRRRESDGRLPLQQARHPPSVLRDLRHRVLRQGHEPEGRSDDRHQRALPRRHRSVVAQCEKLRRQGESLTAPVYKVCVGSF